MVRQLVDEHGAKVFLVLAKAYDTVPRAALWHSWAYQPWSLTSICESMKAKARFKGKLTEGISVENGRLHTDTTIQHQNYATEIPLVTKPISNIIHAPNKPK